MVRRKTVILLPSVNTMSPQPRLVTGGTERIVISQLLLAPLILLLSLVKFRQLHPAVISTTLIMISGIRSVTLRRISAAAGLCHAPVLPPVLPLQ